MTFVTKVFSAPSPSALDKGDKSSLIFWEGGWGICDEFLSYFPSFFNLREMSSNKSEYFISSFISFFTSYILPKCSYKFVAPLRDFIFFNKDSKLFPSIAVTILLFIFLFLIIISYLLKKFKSI